MLLSGLFLFTLTLLGRLGQFVGALLSGLDPPQLLQIADCSLQMPLLLGIGLSEAFQGPLDLMQLLQGVLAGLPRLPQLRIPTG